MRIKRLLISLLVVLVSLTACTSPTLLPPTPLNPTLGPDPVSSPASPNTSPYPVSSPASPTTVPYPVSSPANPAITVPPPIATGSGEASEIKSAKLREPAPASAAADLPALTAGNQAFAVALYQALRAQTGNLMFSPYSISQALAMVSAGARGETEAQMTTALHLAVPPDRLHPAFNALDQTLLRPPENTPAADAQNFAFSLANSVWGQNGYAFQPAFLDTLAQNYGAGLRLTDFANAPEPARAAINQWVSDQTQAKIQDLLTPGSIDANTRLVLVNAVYFKAAWLFQFNAEATQPGTFNLLEGAPVTTPMMTLDAPKTLRYTQGENYQAVELPYVGDKTSMLLLVPAAGRFAEFEAALTAQQLEAIGAALTPRQVALRLPRFGYTSQFSLAQPLGQLGMVDAFTPGAADFSGIDGTRQLFISAALHKTFIQVDEAGTEAAAATAVVVGLTSLPTTDVELTVDRPFLFLIRDNQTGAILFLGRVLNPAQ